MSKVFYAIVIYNKQFRDSITCIELEKIAENEKIIVVDNSEIKNDIQEECLKKNWKYLSMNGNKGISKAYNNVIDYIKKNEQYSNDDAIVLLDDDTKITKEYLIKLKQKLETYKDINIFMPIIKDENDNIISPSKYTKFKIIKVENYKEVERIKQKNFLAINTCLAIRMKIFKDYTYDTKLFLDQVDNQFFYDMRNKQEKFLCIDSIIIQNFFSTNNKDYAKEIMRKKIEKEDYKKFVMNKSILEKIMYHFRILYWKIKGCFKYRNIKYFIDL